MPKDPLDDVQEFHKTNDMALVTFLKIKGHTVQGTRMEGATCYWFFRMSENLVDCIDEFASGNGRVEPREYNRVFSQTKGEFFHEKDKPVRR